MIVLYKKLKLVVYRWMMLRWAGRDIGSSKYRSLRVDLLKSSINHLHKVMRKCLFEQDLLVKPNGDVYVISDGILLDATATNRYLKVSNGKPGNQGKQMLDFLKQKGVRDIKKILDIGANVGEISLYFSKNIPECRVVAVEPSPRNLIYLKKNMAAQYFDTANINIVMSALSDKDGIVLLSDAGSESSVVFNQPGEGDEVMAQRLSTLWERESLGRVDFIKIDIEGAEPLLLEDMREYVESGRAWLIEFGSKNTPDSYIPFFEIFEKHGYSIYSDRTRNKFDSAIEAEIYYSNLGASDDFWFIRRDGSI